MRRVHFDTTDSTNRRAAALWREAPGAVMLVSAETQTAGRGRGGRAWHSPAGGAWFTLVWPTQATPAMTAAAPLVTGLAVCEQIALLGAGMFSGRLAIKWPNDLLLDQRKLAGILCEQQVQAGAAGRALFIGVGINANVTPAALGDELRQPATSLHETLGEAVDVTHLIEGCGERIAQRLRALEAKGLTAPDVTHLNALLAWRGRRVGLSAGGTTVAGVLHGVDERGRAIIDEQAYEAGEVTGLTAQARPRMHK